MHVMEIYRLEKSYPQAGITNTRCREWCHSVHTRVLSKISWIQIYFYHSSLHNIMHVFYDCGKLEKHVVPSLV